MRFNVLKDNKGVVLIIVLSMIVLFTVMVTDFSSNQGLDIELAYNFRDSLQAQYLAQAGVEAALVLLKEDDVEYDSSDEDWGNFSEYALVASMSLEGLGFSGTLKDESSMIDLNALIKEGEQEFRVLQFKRLFDLLAIDITEGELDDLVNAIIDWIDEDDETVFGAEADYYDSLERPYICKNGPMDTSEEILLVKGMKREYFYGAEDYEGIRKYVTVGTSGIINLNTASDKVLMSISDLFDQDVVDSIDECRPFTEEKFDCIQGMDFSDPSEEMNWIKKVIGIKSSRFCVDVKGVMPTGAQLNIKSIIERINNEPRIVYYKIY